MLFSAYRRDEFADPEGFVIQLGVVLEAYSDEIILAVTSPRTGLQRRLKWPPTIAEVVEACEAEAVAIETRKRYEAMPRVVPRALLEAPPRAPQNRGNLFVPATDGRYAEMVAKTSEAAPLDWRYGSSDRDGSAGIWVPLDWWERERGRKGAAPRPFTKADFDALDQAQAAE